MGIQGIYSYLATWNDIDILRLCLVPGKCERKKIGRKNGRKEKTKERNINFFTCLIIYEKFREKKN